MLSRPLGDRAARILRAVAYAALVGSALVFSNSGPAFSQDPLPWKHNGASQGREYSQNSYGSGSTYNNGPVVRNAPHDSVGNDNDYREDYEQQNGSTGEQYEQLPPDGVDQDAYDDPQRGFDYQDRRDGNDYSRGGDDQGPDRGFEQPGSYSQNEIKDAGHRFFGSISQGLASVIEYAFQTSGRPNGYILGEDAGGAFVAGLRYGEGRLYTRDAGVHRVYWQGPSVGYDFGGEGSKAMILVYNLRDPSDIYHRFGGVQGSAYVVGGVSIQFQKYGDVVLAPIRSGVGLRLGANVGYLKYTRAPTWNPF